MRRREFLSGLTGAGFLLLLPAGLMRADVREWRREHHPVSERLWDLRPLARDPQYWQERLEEEAWRVLFREETERAYSSPLDDFWEDGSYVCAACYLPLFSSETKYDSGTGWPSFWQPYTKHVATRRDRRLFMERTEYHCFRCGGHQGHVFEDGPRPTGQRWCNNGRALRFVPADDPLPTLRGEPA